MSNVNYVAVIYKDKDSKQYHIENLIRAGGSYSLHGNSMVRWKDGEEWKYYFIRGVELEDVIHHLQGTSLHGVQFLIGEYDSNIINYAFSRVRRQ